MEKYNVYEKSSVIESETIMNSENENSFSSEKREEEKLKAKFPNLNKKPTSQFLMKKINQRKYFDSGDWSRSASQNSKGCVLDDKNLLTC